MTDQGNTQTGTQATPDDDGNRRVIHVALLDAITVLNSLDPEAPLEENAYRLLRFAYFIRGMSHDQVLEVTERLVEAFNLSDMLERLTEQQ